MTSRTAPGPDMISAYRLKKLTVKLICVNSTNEAAANNGTHPEWLIEGLTVLNLKDPQKGLVLSNYWSITSLTTRCKVLVLIVAKTNGHIKSHRILVCPFSTNLRGIFHLDFGTSRPY